MAAFVSSLMHLFNLFTILFIYFPSQLSL